jgi:hypothetical protein
LAPGGGWLAKPRGWPAEWSTLHRLSPPTWASPPRVDCGKQGAGRIASNPGWPADPWAHSAWGLAHLVHVSNTPHGDDDFDIWSTLLCYPLKCSNLVPKLLKSNKY